MTFPSFNQRTDNVDVVSATDINPVYTEIENFARGVPMPSYSTIQSASTDIVLVDESMTLQSFVLDAARNIYMPATSTDNHPFVLWNRTPSSDNFTATVLTSSSDSLSTVTAQEAKLIIPDGTNGWIAVGGGGGSASPLTTKGDVYTYSTVDARLAVGSDGQVLTADSAEATGIKWATGSGGVSVLEVQVFS